VSEPIGLASRLRMFMTPAMKVVATAPMPGRRTPSVPRAGRISEHFLENHARPNYHAAVAARKHKRRRCRVCPLSFPIAPTLGPC
jgi:hypothetical protein